MVREGDHVSQVCPFRLVLETVMDKWAPLVVYLLRDGPLRYTQLKRRIEGITQKMLTQTLRKLEQEELVICMVYPTSPPAVEYALTPLGETLQEPLEGFFRWCRLYGSQLHSLREENSAE